MKVLVADKFEQSGLDALKAAGCDVMFEPDASGDKLVAAIKKTAAPVLVVRSTQVTEAMMDAGALSLIVRAGAGVNTIDVAAASRRGIYVSNCPGKNSVAVAELTMGLILALDRRIPDNVAELRAGTWNKKEYSKAKGLMGQTLGLLGFGHIGREVAKRARAFGMPVLVWSRRFIDDAEARAAVQQEFGIEIVDSAEALMQRSDIVSVHIALTKDTEGFVDAALLKHARTGAYIINTARAEVMDYAALADAVKNKSIRREHHFRRRACRRRPHQSRRRPVEPGARRHAIRERRHTGSAIGETWVNKHTQKHGNTEARTYLIKRFLCFSVSVIPCEILENHGHYYE